jgi:hypothetical protein
MEIGSFEKYQALRYVPNSEPSEPTESGTSKHVRAKIDAKRASVSTESTISLYVIKLIEIECIII